MEVSIASNQDSRVNGCSSDQWHGKVSSELETEQAWILTNMAYKCKQMWCGTEYVVCLPYFTINLQKVSLYSPSKHAIHNKAAQVSTIPRHVLCLSNSTSCSGDIQYVSRLVRLAKHFVPAAVFDKSCVSVRCCTYYTPSYSAVSLYACLLPCLCCIHPMQSDYRYGKFCLLPFDKFYEKDGRENMDRTTMVSDSLWNFSKQDAI